MKPALTMVVGTIPIGMHHGAVRLTGINRAPASVTVRAFIIGRHLNQLRATAMKKVPRYDHSLIFDNQRMTVGTFKGQYFGPFLF